MMKYLYYMLLGVLVFSCSREPIVVPEEEIEGATFDFRLHNGVLKVDSLELQNVVAQTENTIVISKNSVSLANAEVGDVIFNPMGSDEFHLTKFGRKITEVSEDGDNVIYTTVEPELKDIYEYFFLDANNPDVITIREEHPWTQLSAAAAGTETKLVDGSVLEFGFPLSDGYEIGIKLANATAILDFEYKFSTEYDGILDGLVNFTFKARNIQLKDFTFGAEVEVKRNNAVQASDGPSLSVFGLSQDEVTLFRIPAVPTPFGIPVTINVDFAASLEAAIAGKVAVGIPLGDLTLTGDPLEVRYNFFSLGDAAFATLLGGLTVPGIGVVFGGLNNFDIISYPDGYTYTNQNSCLTITAELQGYVKPSLSVGISLSPVGYNSLAVGAYIDVFGEIVGKYQATACISNSAPPTLTSQACFEVNLGVKLPYLMVSWDKPGIENLFDYDVYRFSVLGEVKSTLGRWPEDCNPFDGIAVEFANAEITTSCNGNRPWINVYVAPAETTIGSPTTYTLVINDLEFPGIPYNSHEAYYFDETGLEDIEPLSYINYRIIDDLSNTLVTLGRVLAGDCDLGNCDPYIDEHFIGFPVPGNTQEYCSFIPLISGENSSYGSRWLKDNMYFDGNRFNMDPLSAGFCYADEEENCRDFGRLYTWHAATTRRSSPALSNIPASVTDKCPEGYHLPSVGEWQELIDAIGGAANAPVLMHPAWPGLNSSNANSSEFGVYPYGYLTSGARPRSERYAGLGEEIYFWTSTESETDRQDAYAVHFSLEQGVEIVTAKKSEGYYCRCISD